MFMSLAAAARRAYSRIVPSISGSYVIVVPPRGMCPRSFLANSSREQPVWERASNRRGASFAFPLSPDTPGPPRFNHRRRFYHTPDGYRFNDIPDGYRFYHIPDDVVYG